MEETKHVILLIYVINILLVGADIDNQKGDETSTETETSSKSIDEQNSNDDNNDNYMITSKDDREEYVLKIPIERPFTPVHSNKNRSLYPVRIIIGESPCVYEKYTYFFNEAASRKMLPFDLLMNATVTIHNEDYYFYDAEDLCIGINDELNVDIWQFDCSPAGICVCGVYFGYIDVDIPPKIKNGQIKYFAVNGLDRKLMTEDGECRSGLKGHCSLLDSNVSLKNPIKCSDMYDCILDESYGPVLKNLETGQTYGICLPKHKGRQRGRNLDDPTNSGTVFEFKCLQLFMLFVFLLELQKLQ